MPEITIEKVFSTELNSSSFSKPVTRVIKDKNSRFVIRFREVNTNAESSLNSLVGKQWLSVNLRSHDLHPRYQVYLNVSPNVGQVGTGPAGHDHPVNQHPIAQPPVAQPYAGATHVDWNGFREFLQSVPKNIGPEFWGKDHEDPTTFLRNMEQHFFAMRISKAHRSATAAAALRGSATTWWSDYRGLDFTWDQFQILLTRQYDSPTIKGRLQAQLYSERQGEKESVGVFLHRKSLLYHHLHPYDNEYSMVIALLELIRPTIRQAIRSSGPRTFDELLSRSVEAEYDEKDLRKSNPRKEETKPQKKPEAPKGPRCWYCPKYHLHRDCEVYQNKLAEKDGKPEGTQENWRRATVPTTVAPTTQ